MSLLGSDRLCADDRIDLAGKHPRQTTPNRSQDGIYTGRADKVGLAAVDYFLRSGLQHGAAMKLDSLAKSLCRSN